MRRGKPRGAKGSFSSQLGQPDSLQKFIDLSRSPVWLGREYVFIDNV